MDMRDAYFHIWINQESHTVLRSVFNKKIYQFRAMYFELTTVPEVITRALAMTTHFSGIQIILYLDDQLRLASSLEEILRIRESILTCSDILIIREESLLCLKHMSTCLGMLINSLFWASPSQKRRFVLRRTDSKILVKLTRPYVFNSEVHFGGEATDETPPVAPVSNMGQEDSQIRFWFLVPKNLMLEL